MYRSVPRLIRSQGNVLKGIFGGSKAESSKAKTLTVEERESLRKTLPSIRARESAQVPVSDDAIAEFDADELLDSRIDTDAIRARGFLKYRHNYFPSNNVKSEVLETATSCLKSAGVSTENVEEYRFEEGNNSLKFEILTKLGNKLKHFPNNGKLVHLERVGDIVEFYETPVKNITAYQELARNETNPQNVKVIENAVRFHPEDKHLYHGGITAFPGTGGEVLSLRQKRILRQFQPKKEWFDYEDMSYDYSRPDKNMPWDPEVANKMDSYTDKQYNLKTKQFRRIRQ